MHADEGEASGAERRRQDRVPLRIQVEYEALEDFLADYSVNLSVGGMFIGTNAPLPLGSQFRLRFRLGETGRVIDTTAEVRWCIPTEQAGPLEAGMGVRFAPLEPADQAAVDRMLALWG